MKGLSGKTVMIVAGAEHVGDGLATYFRDARATVLGPFPTVKAALVHLDSADLAVLDLNVDGQDVYPVADQLMDRAIRFVFYSEQDLDHIPRRFARIARLTKPGQPTGTWAEPGSGLDDTIASMLPRLRLYARLILQDTLAADRLVEATLELAVGESDSPRRPPSLSAWLLELMERALQDRGRDLMI